MEHKKVLGLPEEIFAGLLLAAAAVLGVLFENIPLLTPTYDALLGLQTTVSVGDGKISKPLLLWINDGLMAIFFLFVAVEIKREIARGALSSWSTASLPVYGAIGGIVVPSLVFLGIVGFDSAEAAGWAIPAATDIAFALGVLSLFGKKVPPILKTFLLTLAVVDDLAAIAIIALFYTSSLSITALVIAVAGLSVLLLFNLLNVRSGVPYVLVGIILW
ncbi:MAG TPA: Na+/H+ antiporter NhaA, partial [Paracoccaceae bacterium]|nr:Na+/H+ antiporter NhaA [Paracoccaceae bacterium]